VFRRFARSQGGTAGELWALLAADDRAGAARLAHRLRGVAANLGAHEVARHSLGLEQALRASGDQGGLAPHLAQLDEALATVLAAARALPPDLVAEAGTGPAASDIEQPAVQDALAHLRNLLQNNNMRAMAQFEALRPALARLAPAAVPPLADAVASLRFDMAAALVAQLANELLDKKDDA